LLTRHWHIFDSTGSLKEVEGEGVVGVQPVIATDDKYEYMSGCNLRSEIGRMHGTYTMENLNTHKTFTVVIPSFEMQVPFKLN
jgi:ApaG protein